MNFKFKIVKHVSIHNIVHCIRSSMNSNNNKLDSYYDFSVLKKYGLSTITFLILPDIYIIVLSNVFFLFYPHFHKTHVSYQITNLRMKSNTIFNAHKRKMCFTKKLFYQNREMKKIYKAFSFIFLFRVLIATMRNLIYWYL